jgi:hypothetical protein
MINQSCAFAGTYRAAQTLKRPSQLCSGWQKSCPVSCILRAAPNCAVFCFNSTNGHDSQVQLTHLTIRNESLRDEIRKAAGVDKAVHVMEDAGHLVSLHPATQEGTADNA